MVKSIFLLSVIGAVISISCFRPRERFLKGERLQTRLPKNRSRKAVYQWGKSRLTFEEARKHFIAVGSTGSGKTLTLLLLLKSVAKQIAKRKSGRVLIYDGKTDLIPKIKGSGIDEKNMIILNPFDERSSTWSIADDITTPSQADEVAACLIPKTKSESNPYFADTARRLLGGIIESHIYRAPGKWTLRDVILASKTEARLTAVLSSCPGTIDLLEHFDPKPTFRNVKSHLDGCLRGYTPIAVAWQQAERAGRSVSVSKWLSGNSVLILGNHPKSKEAIRRLNTVMFSEISKQLLSKPGKVDSETWLFLDEFRELGKIPEITNLMITGRSKGAAVCLGFQCIAGLDSVYGREESREILGCAQNLAVLHINSSQPDTRKWASDVLGEHLIRRQERSESRSVGRHGFSSSGSESYRTTSEKIWLPSQFASDLPPASLEGGLTGLFRSGSTFTKVNIAGKKLFGDRDDPLSIPPEGEVSAFKPSANASRKRDSILTDWNEEDYRRLKLKPPEKKSRESSHPLFTRVSTSKRFRERTQPR